MIGDQKSDIILDIKGQICPYTFVRSKLVLEKMNVGEVLEIITDHNQAREDIPRSFSNEGQQIMAIEQTAADEWHIFIRKAPKKSE